MKDLKNERLIKLNEAFKKLESGTIDNETLQNAVKLSRDLSKRR